MRLLTLVALTLTSASAAAQTAPRPDRATPNSATNCPHTTSYLADKSGLYRGAPLTPKKLTELPRGTAYMAVYRRIDGCEVPMTVVEYRNPRRR